MSAILHQAIGSKSCSYLQGMGRCMGVVELRNGCLISIRKESLEQLIAVIAGGSVGALGLISL